MDKGMSHGQFALLCGCSRPAVSKAVRTGRVMEGDDGIHADDELNRLFLEAAQQRAIEKIEATGSVPPAWAALCAIQGKKKIPLVLYPPAGDDNGIACEGAEEWSVDLQHKPSAIATDDEGQEYPVALVYNRDSRPPWLGKGKARARA